MQTNTISVSIRAYVLETMPWGPAKRVLFVELHHITPADIKNRTPCPLSPGNQNLLNRHPQHLIEVEFLEEHDWGKRFLRFGTDPRLMTAPLLIGNPEIFQDASGEASGPELDENYGYTGAGTGDPED